MKQTEEFKLRIDPKTRKNLAALAQMADKSGSAVIRDLINQAADQMKHAQEKAKSAQ